MPSLRELQAGFADALLGDDGAPPAFATIPTGRAVERMAVYRRALFANYRNALGATFPVVRQLVGAPFFDTAVDAFVRAHPSTSGDLNVYGDAFGDFLAGYPHATADGLGVGVSPRCWIDGLGVPSSASWIDQAGALALQDLYWTQYGVEVHDWDGPDALIDNVYLFGPP